MKGTRLFGFFFILAAVLWGAAARAQDAKGGAQDPKKDQVPPKADQETEEEKIRKAIQEEWKRRVAREEKLVTIDVKNAKVQDVIEEFRKQGGVNIDVDYRNIPEDFRIPEFKVVNEPFRSAFEAFLAKAELVIVDESATLIRLSRPARVSFNFRNTDVSVVIDMIARISGANVIMNPVDVKGPVSISVNNVPWFEVLTDIAKTLRFTTVREKYDVIRIIDPRELLTQMEVRTFRLKYIQPPPIYKAKVTEGQFVTGKPPTQQAADIEARLKEFVLATVLKGALTQDAAGGRSLGTLNFDFGTNTFIVRDTKPVLDKVEEILKLIDVEPPQVLIDVKFVSTTNDDLLQFGINYALGTNNGLTAQTRVLPPLQVFNPAPAGTVPAIQGTPFTEQSATGNSVLAGKISRLPFGAGRTPFSGDDQLFLTEYEMIATLRAFKRDQFTKLIQQPTLAVLDNTEATIFSGQEISYAEITTTFSQFGTPTNSISEAPKSPIKVGFQLYVVPKIVVDQNKVILSVIPDNSFLAGRSPDAAIPGFNRFNLQLGGATAFIDLPEINTTTVVTKLIIESGRTAVLGGLVVERSSYADQGIPILKDIPIISYFFKQRSDNIHKEHLLIFITPRIVPPGHASSDLLNQATKQRDDDLRKEMEQLKQKAAVEQLQKQEEERRQRELDEMDKMKRGEK